MSKHSTIPYDVQFQSCEIRIDTTRINSVNTYTPIFKVTGLPQGKTLQSGKAIQIDSTRPVLWPWTVVDGNPPQSNEYGGQPVSLGNVAATNWHVQIIILALNNNPADTEVEEVSMEATEVGSGEIEDLL